MTRQCQCVVLIIALAAMSKFAAASEAIDLRQDWSWPPFVIVPLVIMALLYGIGTMRMTRRSTVPGLLNRSVLFFVLGWMSLVLALDSPLHELGEQLFWAHMLQHEILMLVAAPLLVLSRPLVPLLWAVPPGWRSEVAGWARTRTVHEAWKWVSAPLTTWLLSATALWIWHAPVLFDQTLHSEWMHAAQHASFFLTALLFWWPLVNRMRDIGYGGGLVYIFTTALHTSVLGALLTFASRAWYSPYLATAPEWNLTALQDQQLGGLIMWIPSGTLLLIIALMLLVRWMHESQARWEYGRTAEIIRMAGRSLP